MISTVSMLLAVLAIEPAPLDASSKPCPPTSFTGRAAFFVVGQVSGKEREAGAAAQRARARKLEATVVRGALFEGTGKGTLVVYGAFERQGEATARVAALAKKKIAAAVLWSGKPASAAPLVRVCGDARRAAWASDPPKSDPRFRYVPIEIEAGGARYATEADAGGYFELWLPGRRGGCTCRSPTSSQRSATRTCGAASSR